MAATRWSLFGTLAVVGLVCVACGTPAAGPANADDGKATHDHGGGLADIHHAVCVVHPTKGNQAHGVVLFDEAGGKVTIRAHIEGLEPGSEHAIHIHQYGDARSPDGKSAGGHYNPEGHPHAGPSASKRHAGDLGNLKADQNGVADYELVVDNITIAGSHNPIIGRAIIIHAGADDLKSQPPGAAGARIGIGVIGVANPDVK